MTMEIKNCRICGKMMQYSGLGRPICQGCKKALEEKFKAAKQFLKKSGAKRS